MLCIFYGQEVIMKKILKNLLACFFILVIFGSILFYLGWTQIKIPAQGFGILISKTGGVSEKPIKSVVFSWHWEFLIPTNAQLKVFNLEKYSYSKRFSGELSSGDFYNKINKTDVDFGYNFDFEILCKIDSENIIKLFSESYIDDEDSLKKYIDNACNDMCQEIIADFFKKLEQDDYMIAETLTSKDYLNFANVHGNYPFLDFLNFSVSNVKLPDFKLYQKLRQKTLTYIDESKVTDNKTFISENSDKINDNTESFEEKNDSQLSDDDDEKLLNKLKTLLKSN